MKTIEHPKQEFMARFERYEPASRDSTAVLAFKKCARYYFYKIVLGFREKGTPQYFIFGSAYHRFREVLELEHQKDITQHLHDAGPLFVKAIDAATKTFKARGGDPVPGSSKFDYLTEAKLMECCIVAFNAWRKEKEKNAIEVLAVEQSFEVVLSDGKTTRGGRADQFARFTGQLAGRDFKTTSKDVNNQHTENFYKRGMDPNDQFTGYLVGLTHLSGEFVGMLIVDVLVIPSPTKKTPNPKPYLKQFLSTRTRWQLEIWEEEVAIVERWIDICREEDKWPMCEGSCSYCEYHSVCTKGTEQAQMAKLEEFFTKVPWDYKSLGEE